ncbi:MAG TPA: hypothetical protein VGB94_08890 [Acidobacteriaceae bacterium]
MTNPIPDHEPHHISISEEEPEDSRKNLLIPALLAAVLIAAAVFILIHYTYHQEPSTGSIVSTTVFPIHTNPARHGGMQLANAHGDDQIYLLPVVEIYNHITLPMFIESLAVDVTTADGETLHCAAAQPGDFQAMYAMYPDLERIQPAKVTGKLLRDTRIERDGKAYGVVMVHFPISKDAWDHRQSATLTVSFYHQTPLIIPFPKNQ